MTSTATRFPACSGSTKPEVQRAERKISRRSPSRALPDHVDGLSPAALRQRQPPPLSGGARCFRGVSSSSRMSPGASPTPAARPPARHRDVAMSMAQLLPQAKIAIVTTPQPAAQSVAARSAEDVGQGRRRSHGVIENMAGFTTPTGETFSIFGEAAASCCQTNSRYPLLGGVPFQKNSASMPMSARRWSIVFDQPDSPAGQAIPISESPERSLPPTPRELPMIQTIRRRSPRSPRSSGKRGTAAGSSGSRQSLFEASAAFFSVMCPFGRELGPQRSRRPPGRPRRRRRSRCTSSGSM